MAVSIMTVLPERACSFDVFAQSRFVFSERGVRHRDYFKVGLLPGKCTKRIAMDKKEWSSNSAISIQ